MTDAQQRDNADIRLSTASGQPRFHYRTYGLSVASDIAFPELIAVDAQACADADVDIALAASEPLVPTAQELADGLCMRGRTAQFLMEGVARYSIVDGRRILIERLRPDADDADLRLFALGSAMGALLYQRGIIPLHASAVAIPQGAWAFTGASGAGKSTLASWLGTHMGLPLVTDDVMAAHPHGESFQFHAGPARTKLWADALAALGIGHDGLTRDYSRADKYQMRVRNMDIGNALPLCGLVFLERAADDEPASLAPITGMAAFQAMLAALYRPSFATHLLPGKALFERCMQLARQVPCYRFRRPSSLVDMEANLEPLLQKMQLRTSAANTIQARAFQ